MLRRLNVEENPRFLACVDELWALVETDGVLRRANYVELVARLNLVVNETRFGVDAAAERDWTHDTRVQRASAEAEGGVATR